MDEPKIIGDLCVTASVRSFHAQLGRPPSLHLRCLLLCQDMGWKTETCAQFVTKCFVCETRFLDNIRPGTRASWSTRGKVNKRVVIVDCLPGSSLFLSLHRSGRFVASRQSWTSRRCSRCCPRSQRCCRPHCSGCRSTNCQRETPRKTCWHRRY